MQQQEGFPQRFTPTSSQEDASHEHLHTPSISRAKGQLTEKNISINQRELDQLYTNICQKDIPPKELLRRIKTEKTLIDLPAAKSSHSKIEKKHMCSMQQQINLSNYRELLRTQFQSQLRKDSSIDHLQEKYSQTALENQKLRNQNQELRKKLGVKQKGLRIKQNRINDLQNEVSDIRRKYDNFRKQTVARQNRQKKELKKMTSQKQTYQKLISGLKQSIHILKGKKVDDITEIWKQWRSIFELASLQQCKISPKLNRP